ncbi:MAG: depupylase/deamidase Dop [Corynebacterium sp.]|nr:depupylase/deamidase Dop [Corynebacterium sp.]
MARVIGTETEYGISTPSHPELSPIITSTHAVVAYAAMYTKARSRWDFTEEHPLRDLRGYDLKRYATVPVVDPNALGIANVITSAGARFYVDHAHPEYSSPECPDAWTAMVYDAAGDVVLNQASHATQSFTAEGASVLAGHEPCPPLKLYKNNVDGKGASYGSHENYQYSRSTEFDVLAENLIPYFVARIVVIGAGRVGIGPGGKGVGFQISQRADYIDQRISLETTLNRGIINTRDEPHADPDTWGRLHVIVGDANMSHTSNLLKLGMTSLVLDAIEEGVDFTDLSLDHPVAALKTFSHDPSLTASVELKDGRKLTALEILAEYRQRVMAKTATDDKVLAAWDEVIALLSTDPLSAAHLLDWVAKYKLIKGFVDRGISWHDSKLALIDLQYSDIDPDKSLYHALVRKGQMRTLVSAEEISKAATTPPVNSRAQARGLVTDKFGENVVAVNWQTVSLNTSADGAAAKSDSELVHFDIDELAAHCDVLADAKDVSDLLLKLSDAGVTSHRR